MDLRAAHMLEEPVLIEDLMARFVRSQATDPRDKVFALLGLVSHALEESILPDYQKSASEVYTNMAKHLLRRDFLVKAIPEAGIGNPRKLPDLPSWVLDWSAQLTTRTDYPAWQLHRT